MRVPPAAQIVLDAGAGIVPKIPFSESAVSSYLVVLTADKQEFDTELEVPDHAGQPQKRKVKGRACGVPSALKVRATFRSCTRMCAGRHHVSHGFVLRAAVVRCRAYPGGLGNKDN